MIIKLCATKLSLLYIITIKYDMTTYLFFIKN